MRRARLVVSIVASALAAPTPAARLAVVGATVLSASGCTTTCTIEITTPDPLPDGGVGHAYFFQMKSSDDGCSEDTFLQWSARGLPPGMKLSEDGALDGTPSRFGVYSLDVTASVLDFDSNQNAQVTRRFTLTIHPA